jgi:hypothetical protein
MLKKTEYLDSRGRFHDERGRFKKRPISKDRLYLELETPSFSKDEEKEWTYNRTGKEIEYEREGEEILAYLLGIAVVILSVIKCIGILL